MNSRFHKGLCVIIMGAAGVVACSTGPDTTRKPTGTTGPGGAKPGEAQNVECFGPSNLSTAAREKLADQVCSAEKGRTSRRSTRNRCANAVSARSDAQIVGLLATYDQEMIRQSTAAETSATNPMVRDLAHLVMRSHTRLQSAQSDLSQRLSLRPEETAESRAVGGGFQKEFSSIAKDADFDREFVSRQVEQQQRALMLLETLVSQSKNQDVRCHLEGQRLLTETQLDQACHVWSTMSHGGGRTVAGGRARGGSETIVPPQPGIVGPSTPIDTPEVGSQTPSEKAPEVEPAKKAPKGSAGAAPEGTPEADPDPSEECPEDAI
ncbi:Hypothetical protein A7982_03103 [Minicystis rosea]|nr:Hypothetical protein A7982_03103 [Minicystis rosea]